MITGQAPAAEPLEASFSKLDLAGRRAVIAAVSGGSDSTALLLLLEAHLERAAPRTKLIAVTVDHGLRPDSAAEAAAVARLCAGRGIAHQTLRWTGAKPKTGLPAAAREARYRLLAAAADKAGTDIILTGHTYDDQAETIAMRRRRGKGRGLAGMAPATLYDGRIWILRPLLDTPRLALRDYLRGLGVDWIEDPTNRDMSFERARTRSWGAGHPEDVRLVAWGRIRQAQVTADLVAARATLVSPGLIRLDRRFATEARPDAIQALRILLAVVGGTEHLPDLGKTSALFDRIGAAPLRATLSRAILDVRRTGIYLHREGRGLPEPGLMRDGMIWDGRFRISGDGEGLTIGPLGIDQARLIELPETKAPKSLMQAALAAWPAVWLPSSQSGSPGSARLPLPVNAAPYPPAGTFSPQAGRREPAATPLLAPWARFLPSFDLVAAKAVAELVGTKKIAEPPFVGHNGIQA